MRDEYSIILLLQDIENRKTAPISGEALHELFYQRIARTERILKSFKDNVLMLGAGDFCDFLLISKAWHFVEAGTTDIDPFTFEGWPDRSAMLAKSSMHHACDFDHHAKQLADRIIRHENLLAERSQHQFRTRWLELSKKLDGDDAKATAEEITEYWLGASLPDKTRPFWKRVVKTSVKGSGRNAVITARMIDFDDHVSIFELRVDPAFGGWSYLCTYSAGPCKFEKGRWQRLQYGTLRVMTKAA